VSGKTSYRMEMLPSDFRPKESDVDLTVIRVEAPYAELAKFMHTLVGAQWRWGGRQGWGESAWKALVGRSGYEMLLGLHKGTPIGYSEMFVEDGGGVQISTMGLAPHFIGKGLGGPFLTAVVRHAWTLTSSRVWLSTCSHDHPIAKSNYEARGFKVFEVVEGDENPSNPSFWDLVAAGDGVRG